jgi:hypothetical protein
MMLSQQAILSRRNKLAVVPAKAGTHTAESIRGAQWSTIFVKPGPVVMGPCFRSDDK